jgi:predicted transcriptional regulator
LRNLRQWQIRNFCDQSLPCFVNAVVLVATTTVASMLKIMLDKGLVKRTGAARGATWSAAVTHKSAAKRMVNKLVDHLFDGSADRLVAHMIEGGQLTRKQMNELRELLNRESH